MPCEHRDTQTTSLKMDVELEPCYHQPRATWGYWKLGRQHVPSLDASEALTGTLISGLGVQTYTE